MPEHEMLAGAPLSAYSPEDQAFFRFWYAHMLNDLMQPPLANVDHRTARYIWDAAIRVRAAASIGEKMRDEAMGEEL